MSSSLRRSCDRREDFCEVIRESPITQVTAKAQRVLKFKPTDFATGLKETYKWYLRHNTFPKPDYTFEDQLLATAPVLVPAKV
jgi:hypothetical protein